MASDTTDDQQLLSIPIRFIGEDETLVIYANSFSLQNPPSGQEFVLTSAQLIPPVLLGAPNEQREQMLARGYVSARVVSRMLLNRSSLRELGQLIQTTLEQLDQQEVSSD